MRLLFIFVFCSILSVNGLYGQMPTQQVSELQVTETYAWKFNISFKVPTSSDSAILIISRSPLTSLSLTNKFYGVGSNISGDIKVLKKFYKGTNTINHKVYSLVANTDYYLAIYTFNNNTNGIFYNQTNPPRLTVSTKGRTIGNYYSNLDTNKAVFLSKLGALLRNHTFLSYDGFDENLVPELYERDTFISNESKKFVACEYSNIKAYYTGKFSFSTTNFNREHTLPKNWMNFRGVPNGNLVDYPEGADYHNLTLTAGLTNQLRSDYVFKIPTKSVKSIGIARYSENTSNYSDTNNCFEPQDNYKGNAARCIFYMQICYHSLLGNNWGLKTGLSSFAKNQQQSLLKQWAMQDTPDNFEIARNECIASIQGSRNPFIDFPSWIDCIDFNDIRLLKACEGLVVNNSNNALSANEKNNWDVWYYQHEPKKYTIKLYYDKISTLEISLYDLKGQRVHQEKTTVNEGENAILYDLSNIVAGNYILELKTCERRKSIRLFIE